MTNSQRIRHHLISMRCNDELDADASPPINTPGHREPHNIIGSSHSIANDSSTLRVQCCPRKPALPRIYFTSALMLILTQHRPGQHDSLGTQGRVVTISTAWSDVRANMVIDHRHFYIVVLAPPSPTL